MTRHSQNYYEFGPFRLYPDERRLCRNSEIVSLPPKVCELLLVLVQHPGQILDREDLMKAVWPDTIVEEANLNVHVSALRKALCETSSERYIETLPRRGYRFLASVKETISDNNDLALQADSVFGAKPSPENVIVDKILPEHPISFIPSANIGTIATEKRSQNSKFIFTLIPLILLFAVLSVWFYKSFIHTSQAESQVSIVPLTTFPGNESEPAFSPDGNQIAFVWNGEQKNNPDIYIRLVDGSNAVRITNHPAADLNPTWSPDGKRIAFYRQSPDGDGIYIVPSLGGTERKIADITANHFALEWRHWIHWSPDGKWLVISDKERPQGPFNLYLLSPETGERKRLTSPPTTMIGDLSPAFSPDGKMVAFVRSTSAVVEDLFVVSVNGGQPKRLTFDNTKVTTLAWTPDGLEIVLSSRRDGVDKLWRMNAQGGPLEWIAASGTNVLSPTFAHSGKRLVWSQSSNNTDTYRLSLNEKNIATSNSNPLIASTLSDMSAQYAPDGKKIAFVSNRSGNYEIWVCGSNGEQPTQLTDFRGPLPGSPRWSPDSRQIIFDCRPNGNADIYMISSEGGKPQRLTTDDSEDIVPFWSHDGKWIYFASNRTEQIQIWKMPAEGGAAVQITQQGGFEGAESSDGQWLYYTKGRGLQGIWRIPTSGGQESFVFDLEDLALSRLWTLTPKGILFATLESPVRGLIKLFSFDTNKVSVINSFERSVPSGTPGLSISPDGNWILMPLVTQEGGDLMMMENFR